MCASQTISDRSFDALISKSRSRDTRFPHAKNIDSLGVFIHFYSIGLRLITLLLVTNGVDQSIIGAHFCGIRSCSGSCRLPFAPCLRSRQENHSPYSGVWTIITDFSTNRGSTRLSTVSQSGNATQNSGPCEPYKWCISLTLAPLLGAHKSIFRMPHAM